MSGKGSKPRPLSVSLDEFGNKFDAIFAKNDKNKTKNILNTSNNHSHKKVIKHKHTQEK